MASWRRNRNEIIIMAWHQAKMAKISINISENNNNGGEIMSKYKRQ
jgi:hypothetical protein